MSAAAMSPPSVAIERFGKAVDQVKARFARVAPLRDQAFERVVALGLPTPRDERWKYTNLKRLDTRGFDLGDGTVVVDVDAVMKSLPNVGSRLVMLDGRFAPSLSSLPQTPGVSITNLSRAFEDDPERAASALTVNPGATVFEHLNAALATNGWLIDIAEGVVLDGVHVVHLWSSAAAAIMSHPRLLVRAQAASRFTLVEHYIGLGSGETFTNPVTTFELGTQAHGTHVRLQQEGPKAFHLGTLRASLAQEAHLSICDIALGATLSRLDAAIELAGPRATTRLNGLFYPDGTQHLDSHTTIDHVSPHTESEEHYRGIAGGRGRGVFNGKVIVRPHAQKTSARQSNRNLLLSAQAEIDTKPELEIYANDVKCAHGATTGQLDPQSIYYLQSRGIGLDDARAILTQAFAKSILSAIEHEALRDHVEQAISAKMADVVSVPS